MVSIFVYVTYERPRLIRMNCSKDRCDKATPNYSLALQTSLNIEVQNNLYKNISSLFSFKFLFHFSFSFLNKNCRPLLNCSRNIKKGTYSFALIFSILTKNVFFLKSITFPHPFFLKMSKEREITFEWPTMDFEIIRFTTLSEDFFLPDIFVLDFGNFGLLLSA